MGDDVIIGYDGKPRCAWSGAGDTALGRYHDEVWGTRTYDEFAKRENTARHGDRALPAWATHLLVVYSPSDIAKGASSTYVSNLRELDQSQVIG